MCQWWAWPQFAQDCLDMHNYNTLLKFKLTSGSRRYQDPTWGSAALFPSAQCHCPSAQSSWGRIVSFPQGHLFPQDSRETAGLQWECSWLKVKGSTEELAKERKGIIKRKQQEMASTSPRNALFGGAHRHHGMPSTGDSCLTHSERRAEDKPVVRSPLSALSLYICLYLKGVSLHFFKKHWLRLQICCKFYLNKVKVLESDDARDGEEVLEAGPQWPWW